MRQHHIKCLLFGSNKPVVCGILFFLFSVLSTNAQENILLQNGYDSLLYVQQQRALHLLEQQDTVTVSAFWPHIMPALFFANIRKNILYPAMINQGASTNFCGYASLTHLLLKYHPEIYLKHILDLYRTGATKLTKKTLKPSQGVRNAAGTLKQKGEMDVLHADQLWFLTLADQFKGYINVFDHTYQPGDENKLWAGTNFSKFNRMLKDFTQQKLVSVGSDLIRPWYNDFYDYISGQQQSGIVLLYVNSKYLITHRFRFFTMRAPTHYIVLYKLYKTDKQIEFQYWDYGLRTEQVITDKRLRKLVFGVTTIVTN